MAMTKKDYEAVASAIFYARHIGSDVLAPEWQRALDEVTARLCEELLIGNPRFNGVIFLSKAGYGKRPRVSEVA